MATDSPNAPLILLVDDYEDARVMYGHFLRMSGYEPIEAATGEEALELAYRASARLDPARHVAARHRRLGSHGRAQAQRQDQAHPHRRADRARAADRAAAHRTRRLRRLSRQAVRAARPARGDHPAARARGRGAERSHAAHDQLARTMSNQIEFGRTRSTGLVEVLDRILDKGLFVGGDIKISLAEVELLTIRIRLIVCSLDKAREIGLDWWMYDRHLSPGRAGDGRPRSPRAAHRGARTQLGAAPRRRCRPPAARPPSGLRGAQDPRHGSPASDAAQ